MKFVGNSIQKYLFRISLLVVLGTAIAFLITEHVEAPREALNIYPRPAGSRKPLSLYAVGNINLADVKTKTWFTGNQEPGFAALLREIAAADLAFGNLECQLVSDPPLEGRLKNFSAPATAAIVLANAGFDLLSTANDVTSELNAEALTETMTSLRYAGIRHAGTGRTVDEAYQPAVIERNGWRVALFAVTAKFSQNYFGLPTQSGLACANLMPLTRQIALARPRFDLVLVSYHGGDENGETPHDEARYFAQRCIEAGADIILGHHPHAPQPYELYRDKLIFYSLGDFLGSDMMNADSRWKKRGLAARITISNDETAGQLSFAVEGIPLIKDALPQQADGATAASILAAFENNQRGLPLNVQ